MQKIITLHLLQNMHSASFVQRQPELGSFVTLLFDQFEKNIGK